MTGNGGKRKQLCCCSVCGSGLPARSANHRLRHINEDIFMKTFKRKGRFSLNIFFNLLFQKREYQSGHLGTNENLAGCLYAYFELQYCVYFDLHGGERNTLEFFGTEA